MHLGNLTGCCCIRSFLAATSSAHGSPLGMQQRNAYFCWLTPPLHGCPSYSMSRSLDPYVCVILPCSVLTPSHQQTHWIHFKLADAIIRLSTGCRTAAQTCICLSAASRHMHASLGRMSTLCHKFDRSKWGLNQQPVEFWYGDFNVDKPCK